MQFQLAPVLMNRTLQISARLQMDGGWLLALRTCQKIGTAHSLFPASTTGACQGRSIGMGSRFVFWRNIGPIKQIRDTDEIVCGITAHTALIDASAYTQSQL